MMTAGPNETRAPISLNDYQPRFAHLISSQRASQIEQQGHELITDRRSKGVPSSKLGENSGFFPPPDFPSICQKLENCKDKGGQEEKVVKVDNCPIRTALEKQPMNGMPDTQQLEQSDKSSA